MDQAGLRSEKTGQEIDRGKHRMDGLDVTEDMAKQADGSGSRARARSGKPARSGHNLGSGHDGVERQAIASAKRGDWDGIHYLYARYADDVLGYVQSIVRDHHEAEDITQNVFAKLITAIERYEERAVPFADGRSPSRRSGSPTRATKGSSSSAARVSRRRSPASPRSNARCSSCDM